MITDAQKMLDIINNSTPIREATMIGLAHVLAQTKNVNSEELPSSHLTDPVSSLPLPPSPER